MKRLFCRMVAAVAALGLVAAVAGDGSAQAPQPGDALKEIRLKPDAFTSDASPPAWVELIPLPAENPTAPLSARLFDTQYHVGADTSVFVRRAITVKSASALTAAGQIEIPFVPEYQKAALHILRVHRGTDVIDRKSNSMIRFLQREKDLEKGVYSGEVTVSMLVNDLRVGDTLETAYSVTGQNPVYDSKVAQVSIWDSSVPTSLRRVVLSHPEERKISWRLIGTTPGPAITPSVTSEAGRRRLVWQQAAIAAIEAEPAVSEDLDPYRWLQISEYGSWNELARWAAGLFKETEQQAPELRTVAEKFRKLQTPEERVAGALEFVQNEIRYFSVSMGESSHRPYQPQEVLARRYGDCKDKSLLLIALLRQLDIEAKPIVLRGGSRKRLETALPSPQLFDHAIVQVTIKGAVYYLDPTRIAQHGRLSAMGQVHEGAQVLVADNATDRLVTITTPNSRQLNRDELLETLEIAKLGGEVKLTSRQSWRGVTAEMMRLTIDRVPRDQLARWVAEDKERYYPGIQRQGEIDIRDDRLNNVVTITSTYVVPKLGQERDGNWLLRYSAANMKSALPPPPGATRKFTLAMPRYPFSAAYTIEARLPENVSNMADPRTESVRGKHFSYEQTISFRGNRFKAVSNLDVNAGSLAPADFPTYRETLDRLGKTAAAGIFIPKGIIKATVASRKGDPDLGTRLAGQTRQMIEKATAAIKSGKLKGKELSDVYCLRSNSQANLGLFKQAIADANAAIDLNPEAHSCRGYAQLFAGQFEQAVADYTKAISLGSIGTIKERGIARLLSGAHEAAREDFAKASEDGEKSDQVFADLWLAMLSQRLGQPIPEVVKGRASADPNGEWPRPALAMAVGMLTPADVIKSLDNKTGDELTMARSEGYFYIGQHYLAQKDLTRAREYFEKARSQNVINYLEHMAAHHELQKLGAGLQTGSTRPASQPAAKGQARAQAKPKTIERNRSEANDGWTSRALGGP